MRPPGASRRHPAPACRRRPLWSNAGFTLIEVLAAVFLTTVVIGVAVSFYLNLSEAAAVATVRVREVLHASAVLDRLARDLEGAHLLVKPDAVDPLSHPWFFVAESRHAVGGADRIKFLTRGQSPRVTAYHVSDLALVAYFLEPDEDEDLYRLYRWSSPSLPQKLDTTIPTADDPRSLLVSEGLRAFSLRFLDEEGDWTDEWDSSLLVQSGKLPQVVEIQVALAGDGEIDADDDAEATPFVRRVVLPLRPLDLEAEITAAGEDAAAAEAAGGTSDEDEDGEGAGDVGTCIKANWQQCLDAWGENLCSSLADVTIPVSDIGVEIPAEWGCR